MRKTKTITAVILSAGNSTRFGQDRNKNFFKINGKPIIEYSIRQFNDNKDIDDIIIVVKESEIDIVKEIVNKIETKKKISFVTGGRTRKESVYNGISKTKSNIVIIHDSARPMIKQEYINKCIENMDNYKGVSVAVRSKDTIKVTDDNGIVIQSTQRKNTWNVQTPQCFDKKILLECYEKYKNKQDITDECMLLELSGYEVKLVNGDYFNIKVTIYDDIELANKFINR